MSAFLQYMIQGENGYASAWSLMHFWSGLAFHAVWAWWIPAATWVSLFVVAVGSSVFELAENAPGLGEEMFSWMGYDDMVYRPDSQRNSVTDHLFVLGGWLLSQLVHMAAPSSTAFFVLLGTSLIVPVLFYWLFAQERAQWGKKRKQAAAGASTAPIGIPPPQLASVSAVAEEDTLPPTPRRVRFVL